MKKITKTILLIFIIILIKLLFDSLINTIIIKNYNNEKYSTSLVKILYILNINQPYLPYYNEGTILYQLDKYSEAETKFTKALDKKPSAKYVCDIRTNLSLSMIAQIDENNCELAPTQLKKAREVLKENECSINDKTSKALLSEISELEKEIKEKCQSDDESDDSKSDDDDENDDENKEQQQQQDSIEEQLREQQIQSGESRNDDMEYIENDYHFGYEEGRW